MRKKIQKQLPLMETTSGHTQEIELDIISSITDNTPTISDYVLQDLTKLNCINIYKISEYALRLNDIELGNLFLL